MLQKGVKMKKKLLVLVLILLSVQLTSAIRKPMYENFTNSGCSYCVPVEPHINNFLAIYRDSVSFIRYHVNWPSGSDPMNLNNPADVAARTSWYGVSGVPDMFVDGQYDVGSITQTTLTTYYNMAMAQPCYVELLLSAYYNSVTLAGNLEVKVIAEQNPDPNVGNFYLFTGIASELIPYGHLYFTEFHQVHRDLFPYGGGWPVSFTSYPDTVVLNLAFQLDDTWWHYDYDELYFVVWLQSGNSSYKNIYQSVEADFAATVAVEEQPNVTQSLLNIGKIYPNPFVNTAYIPVNIGSLSAQLSIFDMTGRLVKTFNNISSNTNIFWDGTNNLGEQVAAGAYRVELKNSETQDSKLIIKIN